jgi:hypothetical protein
MALSNVQAANFIWMEGEDATQNYVQKHNWYDDVVTETLSGGARLSHYAADRAGEATYNFTVSETGDYEFWIRANPVADPKLTYSLNNSPWMPVNLEDALEVLNIASNGAPDMRFIGWLNAGKVTLQQGAASLRFKFDSANNHHGAIDCFVFTREPFLPRGILKPGERSGKANPGYFAWEPNVDPFSNEALLDLRYLNEDLAGKSGRVQADGNDFRLGNGEKVKFWGANAGPGIVRMNHAAHDYLAKNMAKHGVNLVRIHGGIYGSRDPKVDMAYLDQLHHLVGAFKEEGIYTALSFYFPAWFRPDAWYRDGDKWPFMLLFFDEDMQRSYFQWADALLKTPNPYTGATLGADPAVAMVEIQNEDSHFFWTFGKDNMPPERWSSFTRLYGDWLKAKYGSLEKTVDAWGGVKVNGDDITAGRMELYGAWQMTWDGAHSNPKLEARIADQVRFLTDNMHSFYTRAKAHFKNVGGYEGMVSCGNWHVSDERTLGALERYCYTAGDVIDHHGYYDHGHKGNAASWDVRPGHSFTSSSALSLDSANPLPYVETDGYPHIISEIGWPLPNMYHGESTLLTAAYGALQGLDGIMNFAIGSPSWDQSIGKFPLNTPVLLGSYYATALTYRLGYIQEAPTVVMDNLDVEDLLNLKGSTVYARPALDEFRAEQVPTSAKKSGPIEAIDPMTFYVGRVARSFEGRPDESMQLPLDDFIHRDLKTIKSITGELNWDYGKSVMTVNTSKAQGATGFLGKHGPVKLDQVTIDMDNDYGSVLVVALDNRPITESKKMLIQCMTVEQFYGWKTSSPAGMDGTIENVGSSPWGLEKIEATITLAGKAPSSIVACDENGYSTDKVVEHVNADNGCTITLEVTSPYTVVFR